MRMRTRLNPADRLTLFFIGMLAATVLLNTPSIASWPQIILKYALLALAVIALAALKERYSGKGFFRLLHAFFPIIAVVVIFNSLGDIIPLVRSRYYDDVLIRVDHLLFAVHPTVWMERFNNAWLTAVLQIAYISYYFMPISLAVLLFAGGKENEFEAAVFALLLCFYLSYAGYLLFPAVGPRFTLNHLQTAELQRGPITSWIQQTLDMLERNKTDAFPSGHTAVALVTLCFAGKFREKALFRVLAPAAAALIISTVYLRYHYVIDVLAGIALALLTIVIAPAMHRLFSGSRPSGK